MRRKGDRRAGVTLIEILIAVTLLSLLAAGVLVAMRLGFNTMDKTNARLMQNRRVVNARRIIESEINGFVYSTANFYPRPNVWVPVIFLQTEPQSMRFVTAYSLASGLRGKPQVAEMTVLPGEKGEGVRLILNETPYLGPLQTGERVLGLEPDPAGFNITHYKPIEAGAGSFVLADRLAFCRFSYLEVRPEPPFQFWRPIWTLQQKLPLGVRIDMAPLDSKGNELHVTTVTAPIRVNRQPGSIYVD